ncbi:MAG: porin [Helicobacteraceae bacterium]|jgi:hypothetical protein|nr:porin [Helicobacteraceae bacterium]
MRANRLSVAAIAALAVVTSAFAADGLVPYGQISGEVGSYFDTAAAGNEIGVRSYASRFGLKGAADVGGVTAVYQLEAGFNPVNGANGIPGAALQDASSITPSNGDDNTLATRNTFVGVAGSFGTFVIGNHDTPYKIVARGAGAISNADTVADLHLQTDRRLKGAVAYIAPADALGGVTVAVAVVPVKSGASGGGDLYIDPVYGNIPADGNVTGIDWGYTSSSYKDNSGFHYSIGVLAPIGDSGLTIGAGYESAYVAVYDDTIDSFFGAVNFKQDAFSVGLGVEVVTAGDDIGKDLGTTTFILPVGVNLDDGLYINAGVKLTQFDKAGAAPLTNTVGVADPDEAITQVGLSFGKKWGKNLDAYVGGKFTSAKNKVIGTGADAKKSATDFGFGLKVAFN